MTECTTNDCGRPTETYLCTQCTSDLQQWINKIPELRQELFVTMAKLDHTAPRSQQGGGGLSTGSAMPLRDSAMELRHELAGWENQDAQTLAHDRQAADFLPTLQSLDQQARKLIDNPEEQFTFGSCGADTESGPCPATVTAPPDATWANCPKCEAPHNVKKRADDLKSKVRGEPMPPREVREYLRENARINIKAKDFENWVYHRHLPYVLDHVGIGKKQTDKGRRIYFPGEVFRVHQAMRDRKNVA